MNQSKLGDIIFLIFMVSMVGTTMYLTGGNVLAYIQALGIPASVLQGVVAFVVVLAIGMYFRHRPQQTEDQADRSRPKFVGVKVIR